MKEFTEEEIGNTVEQAAIKVFQNFDMKDIISEANSNDDPHWLESAYLSVAITVSVEIIKTSLCELLVE